MAEQLQYSGIADLADIVDEQDGDVTVAFSHTGRVWKTRYSFLPTNYFTIDNRFYSTPLLLDYNEPTIPDPMLWEHNIGYRGQFYGEDYSMSLTLSANVSPSLIKSFNSLSLETNSDAFQASVYTNYGPELSGGLELQQGKIEQFENKEGNFYAAMPRSGNNNTSTLIFAGRVRIPLQGSFGESTDFVQGSTIIDGDEFQLIAAEILIPPTTAVPLGVMTNMVIEIPTVVPETGADGSRLIEFLTPSQTTFIDLDDLTWNTTTNVPYTSYSNLSFTKYDPNIGSLRTRLFGMTTLDNGNQAYLITNEVLSSVNNDNEFINQLTNLVELGIIPNASEFGPADLFIPTGVSAGQIADLLNVDLSLFDEEQLAEFEETELPFIDLNIYAETPGQVDGDGLRGHYALIHLTNASNGPVELFSVNTDFSQSKLDASGS
tara:strand:+ start:133 stop:1431 length:1299 start_codon:yes stop_codon:yes gene_type:complete